MSKEAFAVCAAVVVCVSSVAAELLHRRHLQNLEYPEPPAGMVLVPAGSFVMGTDNPEASKDERPQRTRFLPAFYIDQFEVTNAEFKAFDPDHAFAEGKDNYPVTGITRQEAKDYAASLGKRLPTMAEWEKAARGEDGRDFPWGHEFKTGVANIGGNDSLTPVGQHPESVSPYGAHDMVGNAWEWIEDTHTDGGLIAGRRIYEREIIKGGGYSYSPYQARASYNGFEGPGSTCNDVGFRCVKDAERK